MVNTRSLLNDLSSMQVPDAIHQLQCYQSIGSKEEDVYRIKPYMGMAAMLVR